MPRLALDLFQPRMELYLRYLMMWTNQQRAVLRE